MDYETLKHRILEDISVSYWLKKAIAELERRDPLDATNDARLLAELMTLREAEILHRSQRLLSRDLHEKLGM